MKTAEEYRAIYEQAKKKEEEDRLAHVEKVRKEILASPLLKEEMEKIGKEFEKGLVGYCYRPAFTKEWVDRNEMERLGLFLAELAKELVGRGFAVQRQHPSALFICFENKRDGKNKKESWWTRMMTKPILIN